MYLKGTIREIGDLFITNMIQNRYFQKVVSHDSDCERASHRKWQVSDKIV